MKIAICFSGLAQGRQSKRPRYGGINKLGRLTGRLRATHQDVPVLAGWKSIKEHVYRGKHDYDTFFHAWVETSHATEQLTQVLHPTDYIAEKQTEFWPGSLLPQLHVNDDIVEGYIHRCMGQLTSRAKSVQLALDWSKKRGETYDLIVVLRYDLLFERFVDYEEIQDTRLYHSGGWPTKSHHKIYDFFWLGTPEIMSSTLAMMHECPTIIKIQDSILDYIKQKGGKRKSKNIPLRVELPDNPLHNKLVNFNLLQMYDKYLVGNNIHRVPKLNMGVDYHLVRDIKPKLRPKSPMDHDHAWRWSRAKVQGTV